MSPRRYLLGVLTLFFTIILLAGGLGAFAWLDREELVTQRSEMNTLITQRERIIARLPVTDVELEKIRAKLQNRQELLPESSDALASARIQKDFRGMAARHKVHVRSMQVLDLPDQSGPFQRVGVKADMQLTIQGLKALLNDIRGHRPVWSISKLAVRNAQRYRAGQILPADPILTVQMEIIGLRQEVDHEG